MLEANACIAVRWFLPWSHLKFSIISLQPFTVPSLPSCRCTHIWFATHCEQCASIRLPSFGVLCRDWDGHHSWHTLQPVTRNFLLRPIECVLEFIYIRPSWVVLVALKQEPLTAFRRRFADSRNYIDLVSFVEVVQRQHTLQHKLPTKYFKISRLMELKPDSYFCCMRQPQPQGHKIVVFSHL